MNWGTVAWIVIAAVAIFVMMRGCGGMMGGGCGMTRNRSQGKPTKPEQEAEQTHKGA
jgi:anaerobic selenocysteine-containing dehydrogenase